MTTKAKRVTKKKVVTKAAKATTKLANTVTMTVKQAQNLQAFATKNNKIFKFLDRKINIVNA